MASRRVDRQGRRRGHRHRHRRLRHLAGEQVLHRPQLDGSATGTTTRTRSRLPRHVQTGEQFTCELQQQAHRRAVLQRGVGRRRGRRGARARGSSSRRATTTVMARTPRRRPAGTTASRRPVPAAVFGDDQRHRAARPHLRVQGALVDAGRRDRERLHLRPRGRDRPGRRRRRRRHQLLDRRRDDATSSTRYEVAFLFAADAGVFVVGSAGNSGPVERQQSRTRARGSRRSLRARTTATSAAGDARQRRHVHGGSSASTASAPAPLIDSIAAGLPGADATRSPSASRQATTAARRPRSGKGRRQDRRLRPRRQRPHQQEPRGPAGRGRRHDPREHRRPNSINCGPPLRADRAPVGHRSTRRSRRTRQRQERRRRSAQSHRSSSMRPHRSRRRSRLAGPLLAARRRPAEARHHGSRPGILAAVAPPGVRAVLTSTCSAARRCRARTSPGSARC